MSHEHSYKGYAFDDDTTTTEDGRYRARVILKTIVLARSDSLTLKRSQRSTMRVSGSLRWRAPGSMRNKATTSWHCRRAFLRGAELDHG